VPRARQPWPTFGDVLGPVVTRLRAQPDDSLISHLLRTGRTDADLIPVVKQLAQSQLQAGWLGAWALRMLLGHPDQLGAVRADRWLVGAAIYEALRWSSPVGVLTRRTTRPVVLSGRKSRPTPCSRQRRIGEPRRDGGSPNRTSSTCIARSARTSASAPENTIALRSLFVPAIARTSLDVLLDHVSDLRPEPGSRPAPHGLETPIAGSARDDVAALVPLESSRVDGHLVRFGAVDPHRKRQADHGHTLPSFLSGEPRSASGLVGWSPPCCTSPRLIRCHPGVAAPPAGSAGC